LCWRSGWDRLLCAGWVEMRDILFLAHRIPYPPDKGDKIRAWNILQHLAGRYRVHLGTFVDAPEDVCHIDHLRTICTSVFWRRLSPRVAALRGLRSLVSGASLTQGYFGDSGFGSEVERTIIRHRPSLIYIFSSAMAPYVAQQRAIRVILDMVDVDSEKWRQYAETAVWPARVIYSREGRALLALERRAAANANAVIFVTSAEAKLFSSLAPETSDHVHSVRNGVDVDFFSPSLEFANLMDDRPAIVFTGVMDYRPNVDAMTWFVDQVMPRLREEPRPPCLWIVGSNPDRAVRALAGPDVRVTGRVPDIRPYLRHASVVVAPLRIARGVPNKVLEAMSMAAPVIVTPQIRVALDGCKDDELLTATTPVEFADRVRYVLGGNAAHLGARARERVVSDYRWDASLVALDKLIEEAPTAPTAGEATSYPSAFPILA